MSNLDGALTNLMFHGGVNRELLLKSGAEAEIHVVLWQSMKIVVKKRLEKRYRHVLLDQRIRSHRTAQEAQMMAQAKAAGVRTPCLYLVDLQDFALYMELIEGDRLKEALPSLSGLELKRSLSCLGRSIAHLHGAGIVHGDLTTSNFILKDGDLYFLDFGLAYHTDCIEDLGVDFLLLNRGLKSIHSDRARRAFELITKSYSSIAGVEGTTAILAKMREIERRGRYFERSEKSYGSDEQQG